MSEAVLRSKAKNLWYVPDPGIQADLAALREQALLKEFKGYEISRQKKLRPVRAEALRAGFSSAWKSGDYETIVRVGRRVPADLLYSDSNLTLYFDNSKTRLGED